jgi:hypothetical protein
MSSASLCCNELLSNKFFFANEELPSGRINDDLSSSLIGRQLKSRKKYRKSKNRENKTVKIKIVKYFNSENINSEK